MTNRRLLPVAVLLLSSLPLFADVFFSGSPRSTDNDDTCDIATLPAATLLLPYFEVDLDDFEGETTLFTVTNVNDRARVVRVTLWTDYGFPVVSFNIYLTGYDVQSINLRDVLASGQIGGPEGTGTAVSPVGELSRSAGPGYNTATCTNIGHITPELVQRIQDAFLLGRIQLPEGSCTVGTEHANAVGYATMDVISECTAENPAHNSAYFVDDIRYDNVLMGEYQQLNPSEASAQGGTLVHIRAVPEFAGQGGHLFKPDNFPRSFYEKLQTSTRGETNSGGRQPLPSAYFARWINGTSADYRTSFKIWRNLWGTRDGGCGIDDDELRVKEIVLFDEAENAFTVRAGSIGDPPLPLGPPELPATSLAGVEDIDIFPVVTNGAPAGWAYLNLDSGSSEDGRADQAWVISSMRAEGRYSVDMDGTAFGNGCSPLADESEISEGTRVIGPAPNVAETFPNGFPRTTDNDNTCDVGVLPAATLLLPYFAVNLDAPPTGPTTLFTVTNVTNVDQIARVTLWTDYGFPVISFNIYLTGYDVQAINLFDVIARGIIAPDAGTGTDIHPRGSYSDRNMSLDLANCNRLPGQLDNAYIDRMQSAFTEGRVRAIGSLPGCNTVGGEHDLATGYATIDVVANCGFAQPNESQFYRQDLRYDNVLTGDYQQIDSFQNYAQGNPLVHIRAIPEGGGNTNLARTFYGRFAPVTHSDLRQPLPATFGARWIQGSPLEFETSYKIWREPRRAADATCAQLPENDQPVAEVVMFDDSENFTGLADDLTLPATSRLELGDQILPQPPNGAISGWTYFNLDAEGDDDEATQSWVLVSMRSQGRYSVDFDATALGNGCSPETAASAASGGDGTIGPAPNANP